MRVLLRPIFALILALLFASPAYAAPVKIQIKVIEASRTSKKFDKKLESLKDKLPGYTGARLVDELDAKADVGGAVTLEIKERKQILKVKVLEFKKDVVKLEVSIPQLKLSTKTTHKKNNATFIVAHKTGKDTALFLAITPVL